jgi:hypothetical protein
LSEKKTRVKPNARHLSGTTPASLNLFLLKDNFVVLHVSSQCLAKLMVGKKGGKRRLRPLLRQKSALAQ